MRSKRALAGFTLVELMIVMAMIAVLAALATTGFQQYRGLAKSAEAKDAVGSIGRAVVAAGFRLTSDDAVQYAVKGAQSQGKGKGQGNGATVTEGVPGLCNTSVLVPDKLSKVANKKYQPNGGPGFDYQTGDDTNGWRCLRFEINEPQYYQYRYELGGPPISVKLPHGGSPNGAAGSANRPWTAYARGDIDDDGIHSWFVLVGTGTDGNIKVATSIAEEHGAE